VSRASAEPGFDPLGAPVSVLIDFDGTISQQDVGDALLARFVADEAAVRAMDQRYVDGLAGSRELISWDMDVLPRDAALLAESIDELALDEGIVDIVAVVRAVGGAVEIVSDGIGFHIERMLARLGLADLPVATNAVEPGRGAAGVTFPYGHPACHVCGTCKRERVRGHQRAGRAVVFIGDGPSDRYAAFHADVVFAKASLATWCAGEGIAFEPWGTLAEVATWLETALADGRLPPDAAAHQAWAAATRPTPERFMCGPEAWGERAPAG